MTYRRCLVLAVLALACGPPPAAAPGPAAPPVSEVPGLGLGPADDIVDVAVAVGAGGTIHLVWSAALAGAPGALPSYRTFHARGDRRGERWSALRAIDDSRGALRLAAAGRRLHLVTGSGLRHFASADGGASWRVLGELLPGAAPRNAAFDLALDGETLLAAVLLRPDPPFEDARRGPEHRQRLVLLRRGPDGAAAEVAVADFPPSAHPPPAPRLIVSGRRLLIATALNLDRAPGVEAVVERPWLASFESADGGASWWGPAAVALDPAGGRAVGAIEQLDLVETAGGAWLFFAGLGTFAAYSADGRSWAAPVRINPYDTRLGMGETRSTAVAAAAAGGAGRVAWIDHRFRRSDRRIWNPLGGLPWSDDDPWWDTNDVFTVPLAAAAAAAGGAEAPEPTRLTAPGTFARTVEVRPAGDRTLIVWPARTGVGKELTAVDEPPRIFFTFVSEDVPGDVPQTPPRSGSLDPEPQPERKS